MILANLLEGWAKDKGLRETADCAVMDPGDFVRMCEEARVIPVTGKAVFTVNDRPMEFRPLRNGSKKGETYFTTRATADRWSVS